MKQGNFENEEFIRVGTTLYKLVNQPRLNGGYVKKRIVWNNETLRQDYGKDYLATVPKYDGFCTVPDHVDYRPVVDKFLNLYEPIGHRPQQGEPACDLLAAFLAAVLYHALKSGDGNGQQLEDNGRVDIRSNAHGEDRRTRQTAAGEHIQITEHRTVGACLLKILSKHLGVDERNRNARTEAEDQDNEKSIQDLLAQFGHSPGVFKGLKHLKSPRPFRLRLRSSPLRTQRMLLP